MLDANLSDDDEFKLVLLVLRQRQPLKDVRRNANDFQPVVLHNLNPGQQHLKSVVVEAGSCNERLSMLSKNMGMNRTGRVRYLRFGGLMKIDLSCSGALTGGKSPATAYNVVDVAKPFC